MNTTYKRGDVHPETGMVFMGRNPGCRGGMYWATPDKYEAEKARRREQHKARPKVDTPYKRGDVHPETGMVLMGRNAGCRGGLYWVTPEKFAARTALGTRYKIGDVHPKTGLVCGGQDTKCRDGVYWTAPEKFAERVVRMRDWREQRKAAPRVAITFKRGYVHPETGLVYMGRNSTCKDGLQWATPEQFEKDRANRRERDRKRTQQPSRRLSVREYVKKRRATDPMFALKTGVRSRVASLLQKYAGKKDSTLAIVGCSWEELRGHIEKQFQPGMSWGNRSEWHIDHIVPLASAKTEEELLRLCHYRNLQPLWAEENLKKSDKMP